MLEPLGYLDNLDQPRNSTATLDELPAGRVAPETFSTPPLSRDSSPQKLRLDFVSSFDRHFYNRDVQMLIREENSKDSLTKRSNDMKLP